MRNDVSVPRSSEHGFSLIELLIVVVLIVVMAAVALPNIGGYIRNYKVRGAAQAVASEITTARSKAIMTNTNAGVFFEIVDANSFRYVLADNEAGEELGPLQDLPSGIAFVPATAANSGPSLRFGRLGQACNPLASPSTCPASAVAPCTAQETASRCNDNAGGNFISQDAGAGGGMTVTVRELNTNLQRTVRIAPGGRVLPQP
jgi:prepilin-type N-terminal cleavage/methylation domain-containing protein